MNDIHIDKEWVALIRKAKQLGLSIEQIRHFLRSNANRDAAVGSK